MKYTIALNFEDRSTRFIETGHNETIADSAYRQGVNVPLDCANGVCGTCKALCRVGRYDRGSYTDDALSEAEAADGYLLCCQAKPSSNMVIDIPASSAACKVRPNEIATEIAELETLSTNRLRLSLRPVHGPFPMFLPGQYVNIGIPNQPLKRSYSLTSAPGAELATFLIRNVAGGKMSGYLETEARTGDRITLEGPFGSFYLRAPRRPILFIAGGTGVAPFLSMLEYLASHGTDGQRVRLVYGTRDEADLVETDRIAALAKRIPDFSYETVCSAPGSKHPRKGRATDHICSEAVKDGKLDLYLCGPPEMVESGRQAAARLGLSAASIHLEKFASAEDGVAS